MVGIDLVKSLVNFFSQNFRRLHHRLSWSRRLSNPKNKNLEYFFVERCLILLPLTLDGSSQELVLHQNNSIGKYIKLILGAKEVQGQPCCRSGTNRYFRVTTNFCARRETQNQNQKSYSRFLFFGFESRRDQESRWCNRRNVWKKSWPNSFQDQYLP